MQKLSIADRKELYNKINLDLYNFILYLSKENGDRNSEDNDDIQIKILYIEEFKPSKEIIEKYVSLNEIVKKFTNLNHYDVIDVRAFILGVIHSGVLMDTSKILSYEEKKSFIENLKNLDSKYFDFYIICAFWQLFVSDKEACEKYVRDILETKYYDTIDLIFLFDIFPKEVAISLFASLKEQYIDLFGKKRNLYAEDNSYLFTEFIFLLNEYELLEGKSNKLFKALCALSKKEISKESSQYNLLLEYGYLEEEIVYLNYILLNNLSNLKKDSNSCIKVALGFCKTLLSTQKNLSSSTYTLIGYVLNHYQYLQKKYQGFKKINDLLYEEISFKNANTLKWYMSLPRYLTISDVSPIYAIDIFTEIGCNIYKELSFEQSVFLLDRLIRSIDLKKRTTENLQEIIEKYNQITGFDYLKSFELLEDKREQYVFNILWENKLLKISDYGNISKMNRNIKEKISKFIHEIPTKVAFDTIDAIINICGIKEFINNFDKDFAIPFIEYSTHIKKITKVNLDKNYLSICTDNEKKKFLSWIDNWYFYTSPNEYQKSVPIYFNKNVKEYFDKSELSFLYYNIPIEVRKNIDVKEFLSSEEILQLQELEKTTNE